MESSARDAIENEIINLVTSTLTCVIENYNIVYGCRRDGTVEVYQKVHSRIQEVCRDLKETAEHKKQEIISDIEKLVRECLKLSKELQIGRDVVDYPDTMPLNEILCSLTEKFNRLSKTKKERVERYEALRDTEENLCHDLKEKTMVAPIGIPSDTYLNSLELRIRKLNGYKDQLLNEIDDFRSKIKDLMHKIEVTPVTSIELFCLDGPSSVSYSKDTLEKLKDLANNLQLQEQRMIDEADSLRVSLSFLWSRIEVPNSTREKILCECSGYTKGTIAKLKAEINRCEEEKQRNMVHYISKIKNELEDYWARCYFSEEEKKRCKHFYSSRCTEDVANVLEMELSGISEFYSKYEFIYQYYQHRQELWNRLQQLEASSKDAARLFNNRGGALLREENERKKIQRDLPKIEERLKSQLAEFKKNENRDFTVHGEKLEDIIESTWSEWRRKKNDEKTARKVANANTLAVESQLGTTASATKRKLPMSSGGARLKNVSKRHYNGGGSETSTNTLHSYGSSTALNSLGCKGSTKMSKSKTPVARNGRNVVTPTFSVNHDVMSTPSNISTASSYSMFQEHLDEKSGLQKTPCSSTLTPGNILKPRNTPLPVHSSPKTARFTPYYKTRNVSKVVSSQQKSPFKVGVLSKIPTLTVPMKSPRNTPQLKTPRRRLPIII